MMEIRVILVKIGWSVRRKRKDDEYNFSQEEISWVFYEAKRNWKDWMSRAIQLVTLFKMKIRRHRRSRSRSSERKRSSRRSRSRSPSRSRSRSRSRFRCFVICLTVVNIKFVNWPSSFSGAVTEDVEDTITDEAGDTAAAVVEAEAEVLMADVEVTQLNFNSVLQLTVTCIGPRKQKRKPGDWDCPKCDEHNFASRTKCRMCDEPKPGRSSLFHWLSMLTRAYSLL